MRLFDRFFGSAPRQRPDVVFGRYSDAYKQDAQMEAWERAVQRFDQGQDLDAYADFFAYLNDPVVQNVRWEGTPDGLRFEFTQGSRLVVGAISAQSVVAESLLAHADDLNVGFLRRLMEYNYNLKFCRFALTPDNNIALRFDSHRVDASPLKLYQALRELAIHADKQDDLLLDEFRSLRPVEPLQSIPISDAEREAKYAFFRTETEKAIALLDAAKPDPNQYPGGYAFVFLSLAFRLDYFVRPEGYAMDALERLQAAYFAKDDKTPQNKVLALRKAFQTLLERPKADVLAELYRTRSTFGINPPVNAERIAALIDVELPNMDWHLQQNHHELALAVPLYIAGYALFHFAPPQVLRDMLQLLLEITHADFFRTLGFPTPYTDAHGLPDRRSVGEALKAICAQHRKTYPNLKADTAQLDVSGMPVFARSFLLLMKDLNLKTAAA